MTTTIDNITTTIDNSTRDAVLHELEWDPKVDATHIGVVANDGAVVLTGSVPSYAHRWASMRAAERVYGVRAVADEIEVKLDSTNKRDDANIAESIAQQIKWHAGIPSAVKAEVLNGHVTLRGSVSWSFQRDEAGRAFRYLAGVNNISNMITLTPLAPQVTDVEDQVGKAIERMAELDARSIRVTAIDGRVQLHGHVHSFAEKRAASRSAASAPGVTGVDNEIVVTP
jgi:osmotically-inducible protein OsmY